MKVSNFLFLLRTSQTLFIYRTRNIEFVAGRLLVPTIQIIWQVQGIRLFGYISRPTDISQQIVNVSIVFIFSTKYTQTVYRDLVLWHNVVSYAHLKMRMCVCVSKPHKRILLAVCPKKEIVNERVYKGETTQFLFQWNRMECCLATRLYLCEYLHMSVCD